MSRASVRESVLGGAATIAAYSLLAVVWIGSTELAHTYGHWIEGLEPSAMPTLTVRVLPFIGLASRSPGAQVAAVVAWLAATLWPAAAFALFLRSRNPARLSVLAVALFLWLVLFLAASLVVALGLWAPFSLL